ncbi:MarR family winged helix-turn-helix transcriptional regulator [Shinella zoogloeoides]|uniref:MarR family winged helix-turn-helix transcriptional regulator n=1 Tax=Shinella zoogloeoides TaxID=352475 RepID=UPI00273F14FA|nr:MarR family winged helix-turn-helix transcriptional regulator [Shinella zoogloeoides]WLR95214.1 MarR family winged helix-turn-helix transcriptional regulator [Shinella zoogloeoides]
MEKISETYEDGAEAALDASRVAQSVAHQLRRTHGQLVGRFLLYFSKVNLRPIEFGALALIAENPGRKQSQIAAALGIQRANFVALMNDLENRCLTERRSVPNDRRSHALYLTPTGESLLAEARRAEADFEADCLERLGGTRARDQFLVLLRRLFG